MPPAPDSLESQKPSRPDTMTDPSEPPELDLSDDDKRMIKAQQLLNAVSDVYETLDSDDPDIGTLTEIQNTLSTASLLLILAGYDDDSETITELKDAIRNIEKYQHYNDRSENEEGVYLQGKIAYDSIFSAIRTHPLQDL